MENLRYTNYFDFVSDIAKQKGLSFKDAVMDSSIKTQWNIIQKKKKELKKKQSEDTKKNLFRRTEKKLDEQVNKLGIDLSRAKTLPSKIEAVEPDTLIDQYNKRYLQDINNIDYVRYRNIIDITKRPNKIELYNYQSLIPYISDINGIIEDSPLMYELSHLLGNSRVQFSGKRTSKVFRNDVTGNSLRLTYLNNINKAIFQENHKETFITNEKLYRNALDINYKLNSLSSRDGSPKDIQAVYLNDMYYSKNELYKLIFIYGLILSSKNTNNKKLIVSTRLNLGETLQQFYKSIDITTFRNKNEELGINNVSSNFNLPDIIRYLAGEKIKLDTEAPRDDEMVSDISSLRSYETYTGKSQKKPIFQPAKNPLLNQVFSHLKLGDRITYISEDKFKHKIYFRRTELINNTNIRRALYNGVLRQDSLIMYYPNQISQINSVNETSMEFNAFIGPYSEDLRGEKFFDIKNLYGDTSSKIIDFTKDIFEFYLINLVPKDEAIKNNLEYTNIMSIAFSYEISEKSYTQIYNELLDGGFIDNTNIDSSHNRYLYGPKLSLKGIINDYSGKLPIQGDEELGEVPFDIEKVEEPIVINKVQAKNRAKLEELSKIKQDFGKGKFEKDISQFKFFKKLVEDLIILFNEFQDVIEDKKSDSSLFDTPEVNNIFSKYNSIINEIINTIYGILINVDKSILRGFELPKWLIDDIIKNDKGNNFIKDRKLPSWLYSDIFKSGKDIIQISGIKKKGSKVVIVDDEDDSEITIKDDEFETKKSSTKKKVKKSERSKVEPGKNETEKNETDKNEPDKNETDKNEEIERVKNRIRSIEEQISRRKENLANNRERLKEEEDEGRDTSISLRVTQELKEEIDELEKELISLKETLKNSGGAVLYGGSIFETNIVRETDLNEFLMNFPLKGIDKITDSYGNNQKLFILYFGDTSLTERLKNRKIPSLNLSKQLKPISKPISSKVFSVRDDKNEAQRYIDANL